MQPGYGFSSLEALACFPPVAAVVVVFDVAVGVPVAVVVAVDEDVAVWLVCSAVLDLSPSADFLSQAVMVSAKQLRTMKSVRMSFSMVRPSRSLQSIERYCQRDI